MKRYELWYKRGEEEIRDGIQEGWDAARSRAILLLAMYADINEVVPMPYPCQPGTMFTIIYREGLQNGLC
jgi:hypothetical protein